MGWENEVEELLGEQILTLLLENVDSGHLGRKQAGIIAQLLSPADCIIQGKFITAIKSQDFVYDRIAFRQILSDWYCNFAHSLQRDLAVRRLVGVLRHKHLGRLTVSIYCV